MADDLESVFGRADAPRPLPPALRARLGDVLLAEVSASPEPEDAVAARLGDVDADRPLPASLRDRMRTGLHDATGSAAGRRTWRSALVGTAAALIAVLLAGVTLTVVSLSRTDRPRDLADPPTVTRVSPSQSAGRASGQLPDVGAPRPGPSRPPAGATGSVGDPSGVGSGDNFFSANDRPVHRAAKRLGYTTASILQNSEAKGTYVLAVVAPALGPTEGGTRVVIRAAGVRGVRDVRFGGVRAPWVDARKHGRVVVVTPPVTSVGKVDVTLRGPRVSIRIPHAYRYAFAGVGTWF
jgi:hypothetical protein